MSYRNLLVTGTDTGVGKTTVSCILIRALRQHDLAVGVMKPAETGCTLADGELIPQDAVALRQAASSALPIETICPYRFAEPLAPMLAAARAGTSIDTRRIRDQFDAIAGRHDITLVEGAGGLLVPIAPSYTYAELAADLDLALVVVIASKLGCINHALLTIRHAQQLGLTIAGYVLNFITPDNDLATETNAEVLHEIIGAPLAIVPYGSQGPAPEIQLDRLLTPKA